LQIWGSEEHYQKNVAPEPFRGDVWSIFPLPPAVKKVKAGRAYW